MNEPATTTNQRPEQHVHAKLLVLGSLPPLMSGAGTGPRQGSRWRSRTARSGCAGAHQRVGEPLRHVHAVELLAFHRVVRGEAAQHDLEDEQRHHEEQVLAARAARRERHARQRIVLRGRGSASSCPCPEGPGPDQEAHARDHQHHAGDGPDHVLGRGRLSISGSCGQLLGGGAGAAAHLGRALGAAAQAVQKKKPAICARSALGRCFPSWRSLARLLVLRRVAEELAVVLHVARDGLRSRSWGHGHGARWRRQRCWCGIPSSGGTQHGLAVGVELVEGFAIRSAARPVSNQASSSRCSQSAVQSGAW